METTNHVEPQLVECIAQNIFHVMPLLRKRLLRLDVIQAEHGIPLSHVQVLSMLNETGHMSVSEISKRFGIAKPNITPLVDRLINAGLVDRMRNNTDRRVVNVVILEAGRAKLQEIQESIYDHVLSWSAAMSREDYEEFSRALQSIVRILGEV